MQREHGQPQHVTQVSDFIHLNRDISTRHHRPCLPRKRARTLPRPDRTTPSLSQVDRLHTNRTSPSQRPCQTTINWTRECHITNTKIQSLLRQETRDDARFCLDIALPGAPRAPLARSASPGELSTATCKVRVPLAKEACEHDELSRTAASLRTREGKSRAIERGT